MADAMETVSANAKERRKEIESRGGNENAKKGENMNELVKNVKVENGVLKKNVDIINVLKNSEKKKLNASAKQLAMQKKQGKRPKKLAALPV